MRIVVLETSAILGEVAIADEHRLLDVRKLSAARKHARDLIPELKSSLDAVGWKPASIDLVIVDVGPGSYTGLRVGVMTAKTFAYATGSAVVAIEAPVALAEAAPPDFPEIVTLIDAQLGRAYISRFSRPQSDIPPFATGETTIEEASAWAETVKAGTYVTGPAIARFRALIPPACIVADSEKDEPTSLGLWRAGLRAYREGQRDDLWTIEPLYLRASSAEEKWERRLPPDRENTLPKGEAASQA